MLWYRRTAKGWDVYVIDDAKVPIGAGGTVADVDGDGDLDILFGGKFSSNEIWWWENPAPRFNPTQPWTRRTIKKSGDRGHHDMIAGDFDGDGRLELAAWNQGGKKLLILNVPDDPKTAGEWSYKTGFTYTGGVQHEGLARADINRDGKLDIIGGGYWFEHQGGMKFTAHLVDDAQHYTRAAAGDLKTGGFQEIVFVAGDTSGPLKWYEWNGRSWVGHDLLRFEVNHGHSLAIADGDGDGNLDIFCGEMGSWGKEGNPKSKAWVFYGDGRGGFKTTLISTGVPNHESSWRISTATVSRTLFPSRSSPPRRESMCFCKSVPHRPAAPSRSTGGSARRSARKTGGRCSFSQPTSMPTAARTW